MTMGLFILLILELKKNIYVVERFKNDTEFYEDTLPEYILNDE